MDQTVANFLQSGPVHSTSRSHRCAATGYSLFLLQESKSRSANRIQFTRKQLKDLREWDPSKPVHMCPKSLAVDSFFARFLIDTLKKIQDELFAKPTLRQRQG